MADTDTPASAQAEAQRQCNLEVYKANREEGRVLQRAAADYALLTLRTLILLNGGASIGVLTYLGNVWSKGAPGALVSAHSAAPGLIFFILGLVYGTLSSGLSYVSQILFVELDRTGGGSSRAAKWGNRVRYAAVLSAFFSLLAFIVGAILSLVVFQTPLSTG